MQGWRLSCGPVPRVSPWEKRVKSRWAKHNQLLFDGVFSYSYDPEGNRTARYIDSNSNGLLDAGDTDATTYAWDHRNRLTRVTDYATYGDPATRAVDYLYDVENRWIGRDVDLDADGQIDTRTRFAYDGNQIALQFDRADATTGDPADLLTIDHLSHRYLWNPAAVDQLMADEHVTTPDTPGAILWPLADHLGTIRDLAAHDSSTDATTVVNHRTFDAYGNLQSQTSTNPAHDTLFAFTGRPLDQITDLQNNLHRWYDAATGRWVSEDPIGFEGRDANVARYVGNSPVNCVDPSGLDNKMVETGVKGIKLFIEWFPGKHTGEIKILTKKGAELAIAKWILDPNTGLLTCKIVERHGGAVLPGVAKSVLKKIMPKLVTEMTKNAQRIGGTWLLTKLANPATTGGRIGLQRAGQAAGSAVKAGAGLGFAVFMAWTSLESPAQGAEIPRSERIYIDWQQLGLTEEEILQLSDVLEEALPEDAQRYLNSLYELRLRRDHHPAR